MPSARRIVRLQARVPVILVALMPTAAALGIAGPPPVPSSLAPHPSAPRWTIAGMTLEVRKGRVVVSQVATGSPAERAGVLPLDIVLVANDRSLVDLDPISPAQVSALLQDRSGAARLVLGRSARTLSVDLPAPDAAGGDTSPEPAAPLRVGAPAPPFTAPDLKGRPVSLSSFAGRPVLLDFWASSCAPCSRAAVPLRRIAEEYGPDLAVVGISLDDRREDFEAFVYNRRLPGVQIFDGSGWRGAVAQAYEVGENGIPRYVLLDRTGRVAGIGDLGDIEKLIPGLIGNPR